MKKLFSLILILISLAGISQNKVRSDMWWFHDGDTLKFILAEKTDTNVIYSNEILMFDVDRAVFDTLQADVYIDVATVTGNNTEVGVIDGSGNIAGDDDLTFDGDDLTLGGDLLFQNDVQHNVGSNTTAADSGFFKKIIIDQNETGGSGTGITFNNGNTKIFANSANDFRIEVNSGLIIFADNTGFQSRNIYGQADNSYDLGITTRGWRNFYFPAANQGSIYSGTQQMLSFDNASPDSIGFYADIIPSGSFDIGSLTNPVDSVYANTGIFNTDVGIGTDNPTEELDIDGTDYPTLLINSDNADGGQILLSSSTDIWSIYIQENDLTFWNTSEQMIILQNGNVGMGTITPDFKLQVDGDVVSETDGTDSIGSVNLKWAAVYADTLYGVAFSGTTPSGNLFKNETSQSIWSNTTNTAAVLEVGGIDNILLGQTTGFSLTTGDDNTFIGKISGSLATIGIRNTFIGANSGSQMVTGSYNVMIGYDAGASYTGTGSVFIGASSSIGGAAGDSVLSIGIASDATPLLEGYFIDDSLVVNENLTVTGDLTVLGETSHSGALAYVSTPGTQTIGTGGTYERLNEGAIAYTSAHLEDFTHSDGRLTYTGTPDKHFLISVAMSIESGEIAQECNFRIAKGGTSIVGSNMGLEFSAANNTDATPLLWIDELSTNDYIEIFGTSDTNADEFDVLSLVFTITEL